MGPKIANLVITVTSGPRAGDQLLVPAGELRTVGRTTASDLAIDDNFMSGIHFELENHGSFVELRDKNSRNKTWVNNATSTHCNVSQGDTIRAGKTVFSVQLEMKKEDVVQPLASEKLERKELSPFDSSPSLFSSEIAPESKRDDKKDFEEEIKITSPAPISSPFESVDSSYLVGPSTELPRLDYPSSTESNPSVPIASGKNESPFDDGSISGASALASSASLSSGSSPVRLVKRPRLDNGLDLWSMMESLSSRTHFQVIVHLRKIGRTTPSHLDAEPVFSFIPNSTDYLPVIVQPSQWLSAEFRPLTELLVANDGILIVLPNSSGFSVSDVQSLSLRNVPGFSENNGFLGWCWPSHFQSIASTISDTELGDLFGETIGGIVFPSGSLLAAYVNPKLVPLLSEIGFV